MDNIQECEKKFELMEKFCNNLINIQKLKHNNKVLEEENKKLRDLIKETLREKETPDWSTFLLN